MAFIKIGSDGNDFTFQIPAKKTENWGDQIKTLFFQLLSDHDHSGSGRGKKLGSGSIEDDAINDAKIVLRNDQPLRARNAAGDGYINVFKINTSDTLEFIAPVEIANDSVSTAKLQDSSVTSVKIADSNVTTAKINDSAVSTAKIDDEAVTQAKLANDATLGETYSQLGNFSSTPATFVGTKVNYLLSNSDSPYLNDIVIEPNRIYVFHCAGNTYTHNIKTTSSGSLSLTYSSTNEVVVVIARSSSTVPIIISRQS